MDAANTISQAEQIQTDTHQTACVKNESAPPYEVQIQSEEDSIITRALDILARRIHKAETYFSSPSAVRDFLRLKMTELEFEIFSVIFLDAQHGVIATEEMFRGTLTQTSVYPREVVKRALHHNAAAVIFAHNHPSGVCEPSRADVMLTDALKKALALADVKALDRFIVAGMNCLSFAERGLL
jgi:DNA repair protein RadC